MIVLDLLFIIVSSIVFMSMYGYNRVVFLFSKDKTVPAVYTDNLPFLTVVIPTYNEEKYIGKKIDNLFNCAYDSGKLIAYIADSNSTDGTQEIVKQCMESRPYGSRIKLIKIKERGKTRAINEALKQTSTDFIGISDADALLDKNALLELVSSFSEGIGAVGAYTILNPKKTFYMKSKEKYLKKDWVLRCREGLIDTCCSLDGKTMVYRKSIIPLFPENAVQDDYLLTLLLRDKGYRSIINPRAKVYEESPVSLSNEIEQKRRQIRQTLALNFQYLHMLFNPRYGFYGIATFPFRRFFPVLLPIIAAYIAIYTLLLSPFIFLTALFLFFFYVAISRNYYLPILFYSTSLALYDIALKRRSLNEWRKIDTYPSEF